MEAAEAAQATQVASAHSDQQQHIFNSLGPYDYQNEPQFARNMNAVKVMARQQLAVSTDSPFSRQTSGEPSEEELREMKRQRAELLRRETEEIRRQLELVRGRLNELKLNENNKEKDEDSSPTGHNQTPESKTSKVNLQNNQLVDSKEERRKDASSPKLRPLTGKSDCPNCNCDRKKTSVCDYCIKFALVKPAPVLFSPEKYNNNNHDDRPIRPMRRAEDHTKTEVVDEVVVPNRLYTISKSLDAKRTKLGEAIEDLQLMMERLKRREDKLEQDRKLAHLYKDQWKFGPTIGGPMASPRARLGKNPRQQPGSYQSRLDANLARDSRSLSGFQHIESAMRLRQYNQKPRPAPRNLQSRPINNHMRSKSLESVRTSPKSILSTRKAPMQRPPSARVRNELLAKSQSEVDLSRLSTANQVAKMDQQSSRGDDDQDEDAIEENLEQEIRETNDEDDNDSNSQQQVAADNEEHPPAEANSTDTSQRAPKTAWIPVFGETEVKTVKRVPTRKVQILDSNSTSRAQGGSKSAVADGRQTSATSGNRKGRVAAPRGPPALDQQRRRATSNNSSQVMNEASRRIQFASNLLDDEHRDSRSRNQIIVNRQTPTPRARQSRGQSSSSSTSHDRQPVMVDGDKANRSEAQSLIADATREISRLETMIGEQQKLLTQLASAPSSAHHDSCCRQPGHETRSSPTLRRSQLIHQLREKLNKTKARLSKTLGEEREKHEQLKQKVDLSLKKQSDLEGENELLKQSLSKCIDTCLRDISSTFESINETLTDSMVDLESGGREDPLKAAQLLEDNRHLKKMKSIIETTESQRRRIFDELKEEKQRSQLLEVQLEQSRRELDDLIQAKQRLELQLASVNSNQVVVVGRESQRQITVSETENHLDKGSSSQQWQQATETNNDDHLNTTSSTTEDSASYNSVEAYRQYIQALSPDLEAIKRERRLILGEFDNIKKMLSDMDR